MSAQTVIERMRAAGLELALSADRTLSVRGPRTAYTAELRAAVAAERSALVDALAGVNLSNAGDAGNAGDSATSSVREGEKNLSLKNSSGSAGRELPASPASPADNPTPVAHAEIRTLPVSLTRHLPLPCTLLVRFAGSAGLSALTTSVAGAQRAYAAHLAVWEPDAFEALALAVQERRAARSDVARLDGEKRRGLWDGPVGNVGLARALVAGADGLLTLAGRVEDGALSITWGELLDALGARLVEVVCEPLGGGGESASAQEGDEVVL